MDSAWWIYPRGCKKKKVNRAPGCTAGCPAAGCASFEYSEYFSTQNKRTAGCAGVPSSRRMRPGRLDAISPPSGPRSGPVELQLLIPLRSSGLRGLFEGGTFRLFLRAYRGSLTFSFLLGRLALSQDLLENAAGHADGHLHLFEIFSGL